MSQERYGIRRFALLNTAGYSLGIFPLENPLSVYGANNLGKSASINALQFPILARMSDMSFGKYSLEQSRSSTSPRTPATSSSKSCCPTARM